MREAIEQLIEDYERRIETAYELMMVITEKDQYNRVNGKVEAYRGFIRELKEVLAHDTGATYNRNTANAERDTPHAPSRTGQAEKEMAASGDD